MTKSGVSNDEFDGRPVRAQYARRLMQRVPPIHRELDDGDIDGPDQREDRGSTSGTARLLDGLPQSDQTEIQEKQNQQRGQPRIPDPISAPHGFAPERSGDQDDKGKGGSDGRRGFRCNVGQRMAPDQRAERGDGDHHVATHPDPGGGYVDVHDADRLALLVVGRRDKKSLIQPDPKQNSCEHGEPGNYRSGKVQEARRVGEVGQR